MNLISIERADDIAIVRLSRPEKRNALSFDLLRQLLGLAKSLRRDRRLRAVILAGEGDAFCAGIDLAELGDRRNRWFALWSLLRPGQNLFQRALLVWRELPVPVIAVLHGHCYGAGMQLALAADLRIATPDCRLSIMEARWGLVPDMGLTASMRGQLAADVARELIFSARVIDGREAQSKGLVSHIDEQPMQRAIALAEEFRSRSPDALAAAKQVLQAMMTQGERASLALEKRWQLKLLLGRNSRIAREQAKAARPTFGPRQF